jgi:hypothetical protein
LRSDTLIWRSSASFITVWFFPAGAAASRES